jgi:hypothetical protein
MSKKQTELSVGKYRFNIIDNTLFYTFFHLTSIISLNLLIFIITIHYNENYYFSS